MSKAMPGISVSSPDRTDRPALAGLKRIHGERNIPLIEVARWIGKSVGQMSRIERGHQSLKLEDAATLAEKLEVQVGDLL